MTNYLQRLCLKWRLSNQQCEQDASDRPNINRVRMTNFQQHFRSNVIRSSAQSRLLLSFVVNFCRQSKITNLDNQIVIQEQIAQLQVSMDDFETVKILTAVDNLNTFH